MSHTLLFLLSVASLLPTIFCRHVVFPLFLSWETGAPDGNERSLVYTNGQFPAPELRLKYGDTVEIPVYNDLAVNATIHFHGIEQKGTPFEDGVPGLTQLAIQPGENRTYKWTATQYGSYWYHGHFSGLVSDGLYGAIFIEQVESLGALEILTIYRPPEDELRPYSYITNDTSVLKKAEAKSRSVLLSDWSKFTSEEYLAAEQASGLDLFCQDSILVNGEGSVNCQTPEFLESVGNPNLLAILKKSNLTVSDKGCTPLDQRALTQGQFNDTDVSKVPTGLQSGCQATDGFQADFEVNAEYEGWASFNFISAMSSKAVVVSIDEHPLWIYAIDGQYVQPQQVDSVLLYNGERYSALVKLDKPGDKYTIRVANNLPDQLIAGYATLSYSGDRPEYTSVPSINYAGNPVNSSVRVLQPNTLLPFNQPPPSDTVDATYVVSMGRYGYNWQWTLNNRSTWAMPLQNLDPPLLYSTIPAVDGDDALVIRTQNGTWVDIVLEVTLGPGNPAQPPHPTHKHGNRGYLIGAGYGRFNYSSVAEAQQYIPQSFNISTAVMRDTFTTPAVLFDPAWVVLRYQVTNPGTWLLHCHIETHLAGGMAMAILDGVDEWPQPE